MPPLRYWEPDRSPEPLDVRLGRLNLRREKAALRAAVLGTDASSSRERDLGLPPAKQDMVSIIAEDYDALIREFGQPRWSVMLPSERTLLETLKQDKRSELLEVLTPEELAEYEFRTSNDVLELRRQMRGFLHS